MHRQSTIIFHSTHEFTSYSPFPRLTIEAKGREIFEMILRVASGERSKSEQLGYGEAEFAPWQIGATM